MNLCILCLDALREDHVTPEVMPQLSGLAVEGRMYKQMRTAAMWTAPSVAAIMIGRDAAFADGPDAAIGLPSIAGKLARSHASGAFVANATIRIKSAIWIFGDFDYVWDVGGSTTKIREPYDVVTDAWRTWRDKQAGLWFSYIHLAEPHEPYAADIGPLDESEDLNIRSHLEQGLYTPFMDQLAGTLPLSPTVQAYIRRKYRAYCTEVDGWLAEICNEILDGHTLLVITSDHGDALGDEGIWGHGWDRPGDEKVYCIDAIQRVPCIVAGPGVEPGIDKLQRSNAALSGIAIGQLRTSIGATPTATAEVASQLKALGYVE